MLTLDGLARSREAGGEERQVEVGVEEGAELEGVAKVGEEEEEPNSAQGWEPLLR